MAGSSGNHIFRSSPEKSEEDAMTARAIKKITVKRLFGSYDYLLSPAAEAEDPDRLLILYGDNGSGKTTILRALFHLLAPEIGQGHKTALAAIPFSRFEVDFTTGDQVWLQRTEGKLTGGFTLGHRLAKRKEKTCEFRESDEGNLKGTKETNAFMQSLGKLNLALYFLSDDRTIRLAGIDKREMPFVNPEVLEEEMFMPSDMPPQVIRRRHGLDAEQRAQSVLIQSIKRAEQWIQSQAVRSSSQGESSVNALYSEILGRITRLPLDTTVGSSADVKSLETRIKTLGDHSRQYAKYGLLPEFHGKNILGILKAAPPTHTRLVADVLTPYIESVEKKLDAMATLQRQIDALVGLVNSFYSRKTLVYEIHEGFHIITNEGKPIRPQMLSSGERHLLLLFCNTIQALDKPSIFIIDEPEISLNIKWQRRLLTALRECAGSNPVQYIFATHSFEILAQCRNNAIKLIDISGQPHGSEAHN
jgi:energy-coupling factor transporter ATP-binding protein EcfA2